MNGPFYVVLERGKTPKKAHATLDSARTEARRLFELFGGSRWVRVLQTVEEIDSTHLAHPQPNGVEKRVPKIAWKRRWGVPAEGAQS